MPKRTVLSALTGAVFTGFGLIAFLRSSRLPVGSNPATRRFRRRHRAFLRILPRLRQLIRCGIDRQLPSGPATDQVVHLLARRTAEDFEEIILLASNGFGFGALSLLRGMYERVVTAFYLHYNPNDTDAF